LVENPFTRSKKTTKILWVDDLLNSGDTWEIK